MWEGEIIHEENVSAKSHRDKRLTLSLFLINERCSSVVKLTFIFHATLPSFLEKERELKILIIPFPRSVWDDLLPTAITTAVVESWRKYRISMCMEVTLI